MVRRDYPGLNWLLSIADTPEDGPELRLRHRLLIAQGGLMSVGGVVMIALVLAVGRVDPAMAPFIYVVCTIINFVFLHQTKRFVAARRIQLTASLILPFFFQWSMGGFVESGGVMLWALLALVGSLLFETSRTAFGWLAGFLVLTIVSALAEAWLAANVATGASATVRTIFFAVNIGSISTIVFALVSYMLSERNKALSEAKEARSAAENANVALDEANEQLEAALFAANAATRAKSEFLATMSHELRTPMNAIIGYAEMVSEDLADSGLGTSVEDMEKIGRASAHLLGLINDVLDIAKVEAGKMEVFPESFSLPEVLEEVRATIEPSVLANGNVLTVEVEPDIDAVCNDITKTRQCLLNLLSNATKFTENGSISLHARACGSDRIRIDITDTGIGMTEEQLGRIFEKFTQADSSTQRKFGGTGLGLALTKQLAQMMGGDVWAVSTPGKGTTFTLEIARQLPAPEERINVEIETTTR